MFDALENERMIDSLLRHFGLRKDNIVLRDKSIMSEMKPYVESSIVSMTRKKYGLFNSNTVRDRSPYYIGEFGVICWTTSAKLNDDYFRWWIHTIEIVNEKKFTNFAAKYLEMERVSRNLKECLMHMKMKRQ